MLMQRSVALVALGWVVLLCAAPVSGEVYDSQRLPNLISCYGSASSPDGDRFYTVSDNGIVGVFDAVENRYLNAIDLRDIATWTTGAVIARGKLYVESFTHVVVIDLATEEVVAMIEQRHFLGSHFGSLVASPDGATVYAIVGSTTHLTMIDTETDTIMGEFEVGGDFTGLGISPDGRRLYVSSKEEGRVLVFDVEALEFIGDHVYTNDETGFLSFPTQVDVGPDGTVYVNYVGDDFLGRVAVLDPDGNLVRTFEAASFATGVSVTDDGQYLVLGSGQVLGTQEGDTAAQFVLPVGLSTVSLSPDGTRAFITNINTQYLYTIEGFTPLLTFEGTMELGQEIVLHLRVPQDAGRMFQILASAGADRGIVLPDSRIFPLNDDYVLRYSRDHADDNPIFHGFVDFLDEEGRGSAVITVSEELLDLMGENRVLHVAFATVWNPPPTKANVKTISNLLVFELPEPPVPEGEGGDDPPGEGGE
jgi:DNA-binding beta-propeller fold protein YncE